MRMGVALSNWPEPALPAGWLSPRASGGRTDSALIRRKAMDTRQEDTCGEASVFPLGTSLHIKRDQDAGYRRIDRRYSRGVAKPGFGGPDS